MMFTTASDNSVTDEPSSLAEFILESSEGSMDRKGSSTIQDMSITEPRELDTVLKHTGSQPEGSLMSALLKATKTEDFANVISNAWSPGDSPSSPGMFPNLSQGELLLNAIPLSQKLLACMAAHSIDMKTAYACADLLGVLGLDQESAMLLRPSMVLEAIIRLFTSEKEETRGAALRCMTTLITGSKEYCQCFVKNNIIRSIFDSVQQEKSQSVAAYACRTAISLAYFLAENEEQLEALLSDILPGLLSMLAENAESAAKFSSLQCLSDIRKLPSAAEKMKQDDFVNTLASLISNDDKQIQVLAIELFGPYVTASNSEELRQLPPFIAYQILNGLNVNDASELEQFRLALLDSLLTAVHHNSFKIEEEEAQFLTDILLGNSQVCSCKVVDILVVAWDIEVAQSLAKIEGFLSQLPQVMTVTQAALRIIHSMLHARAETCHEMAKVIGQCEIQSLRKQMEEGDLEVVMLVVDIFLKMIEEGRLSDLVGVGVIQNIVQRMDSESTAVKQRCWKFCKCLLEEKHPEASEECIQNGVVEKCGKAIEVYQDASSLRNINWDSLRDLFQILKLVSNTKDGSRAIFDVGFLSLLMQCLESGKGNPPELFEILTNILSVTPVSGSRLFIENGALKILAEAVQSNEIRVKRESFQLLKLLNFKESSIYLQDSDLVSALCSLLQDSNPRLTHDVVTVLCRISKCDMDSVCSQIVKSGLSSALWSASRSIPANSEEYKTLWKLIQGIRSVEASEKASTRQKQADTPTRTYSTSSSYTRGNSVGPRTPPSLSRSTRGSSKRSTPLSVASKNETSTKERGCIGSGGDKEGNSKAKSKDARCRIPASKKKGK
eukprot:g3034.t1